MSFELRSPMNLQTKPIYEFNSFRLDPAEQLLLSDGRIIPLPPKAFELLLVMVEHAGHLMEKDELLTAVWPGTFVQETNLTSNISHIRKALGESESGLQFIETVPKRGYRFVAQVKAVEDARPRLQKMQAVGRSSGDEAAAQKSERRKKSLTQPWGLAAGLLALVLAGFGWFISRSRPSSTPRPSQPIPLTSYPGTELSPTFSPDGSQVAFSWNGERQDNFDIYVKLVDGSDALRLTSHPARDSSPAWSPDNRHIAFVRDGTIFLIAPLGGAERKVADVQAFDIAWTPDGKSLVVSAGKFGERRILLLSVDTGQVKELTASPFTEYPVFGDLAPAVSPDGLQLVFVRQSDLYLMPLAGGEPRRLTRDEGRISGVSWTADGRELVYAWTGPRWGAMALWRRLVETPAGSPSKRIEGVEPGAFKPVISHPAPGSPARLAYVGFVLDTNIWVRETTASSPPARKLVASTRPDTNPQFSPDGGRLAFKSERSGSPQIWVANSDGSNPLQLTSFSRGFINCPRWSPDGNAIVFTALQNSNQDIYSISPDGGSLRRLTSAPSREGRSSWSRDGRWIYFYSTRSGREDIWRMPAEGGEAIQLTTDGGHESFESPDGKLLYYEDFGVKGLRSIPIETYSGPREGSSVLGAVQPGFWAITEKAIYFVEFGDRDAISQDFFGVLSDLRVPSVSSQIKFYDFRTRKVTQIGTIEKDVQRGDCGLSATWDGRTIAWTQIDQRESDLMMIENFR
jgi:Tol biopolymer transport system component/DNA-binding winged helix-turn-helix (wHTH) protein